MNTLCVWCRRDGDVSEPADPLATQGLCQEHISRFSAEVERVLQGDEPSREGEEPAQPHRTRARAGRRVADALVEQVANVLVHNPRMDLCDACIGAEVRVPVNEVQEATTRLATSSDFLRDQWRCSRCGVRRLVTRARSALLRGRTSPSSAA